MSGARREFGTAFVTTQCDYKCWNPAKTVPGLAALNRGNQAEIESISCAATRTGPATCTAAWYYTDGSGSSQAMVVTETNSRMGQAIELPGTAALNTGGYGQVRAVSCPSPGHCGAVGVVTSKASQLAFGANQLRERTRPHVKPSRN